MPVVPSQYVVVMVTPLPGLVRLTWSRSITLSPHLDIISLSSLAALHSLHRTLLRFTALRG